VKKIVSLVALVVFAAGLIFISSDTVFAKRKKGNKAKVAETKAPVSKLIYKFKDDKELGKFEKLYVSKQATFGRMGVLQAYFAMEQNNLTQIDKRMEKEFGFKMDPSKMYDLNRDKKEIREVGPVPKIAPIPAPAK